MIKQTLEYKDIDEELTTRTVMFNLTQFEVEGEMELEVIQARFQKFQDEVIGNDPTAPVRDMTAPEKREILGMVKTIVKHSYGVREGKRFRKTRIDPATGKLTDPEIWAEFEESGAFSAFIYWLFEKPERANTFMSGIWPQGVERPDDGPRPDLKVVKVETIEPDATDEGEKKDTTPSIEGPPAYFETKDNLWDYSREELMAMGDGEFDAVMRKFTDGKNVPAQLLVIDRQRKNRETTE